MEHAMLVMCAGWRARQYAEGEDGRGGASDDYDDGGSYL